MILVSVINLELLEFDLTDMSSAIRLLELQMSFIIWRRRSLLVYHSINHS